MLEQAIQAQMQMGGQQEEGAGPPGMEQQQGQMGQQPGQPGLGQPPMGGGQGIPPSPGMSPNGQMQNVQSPGDRAKMGGRIVSKSGAPIADTGL